MTAARLSPERWRQGLTLEAYTTQMGKLQPDMRRRLQTVRLSPPDIALLSRLDSPLHVLVLTENFCGDSLMNLPILASVVSAAPGMDLRIFLRSQNPDLVAGLAARGIHAIPVFVFMDEGFSEIGLWVERPQPAHGRLADWWARHPRAAALRSQEHRTREEALELKKALAVRRGEMARWYDEGLQQATVDELKALLHPVLGGGES